MRLHILLLPTLALALLARAVHAAPPASAVVQNLGEKDGHITPKFAPRFGSRFCSTLDPKLGPQLGAKDTPRAGVKIATPVSNTKDVVEDLLCVVNGVKIVNFAIFGNVNIKNGAKGEAKGPTGEQETTTGRLRLLAHESEAAALAKASPATADDGTFDYFVVECGDEKAKETEQRKPRCYGYWNEDPNKYTEVKCSKDADLLAVMKMVAASSKP